MQHPEIRELESALTGVENLLGSVEECDRDGLVVMGLVEAASPRLLRLLKYGVETESHIAYCDEMARLREAGDAEDTLPF